MCINTLQTRLFTPIFSEENVNLLCEVERLAWSSPGENITANLDKIAARLEVFPTGVTLATVGDKPAGSQFAFTFDWDGDLAKLTTWDELTNYGWTSIVHRHHAKTGFLVGVGVVPEFRGLRFMYNLTGIGERKISELLIILTLRKLFECGVNRVIACARVPAKIQQPQMEIGDYCRFRREDGQLYDPVLRFHERLGASIIKPVAYAMEDAESMNAGCWVKYDQTL